MLLYCFPWNKFQSAQDLLQGRSDSAGYISFSRGLPDRSCLSCSMLLPVRTRDCIDLDQATGCAGPVWWPGHTPPPWAGQNSKYNANRRRSVISEAPPKAIFRLQPYPLSGWNITRYRYIRESSSDRLLSLTEKNQEPCRSPSSFWGDTCGCED